MCVCVSIQPCIIFISLPIRLAAACLSVHRPGESMFCQLLFKEPSSKDHGDTHKPLPLCLFLPPPRIKLFHWDWSCRWSEGWRLDTHNIHAKIHSNRNSDKLCVAHSISVNSVILHYWAVTVFPYIFVITGLHISIN